MRGINNDHSCTGRNLCLYLIPVHREFRKFQIDVNWYSSVETDNRIIRIIRGIEYNHLITRCNKSSYYRINRLGCSRSYGYFCLRVDLPVERALYHLRNNSTQSRYTTHRRVLVMVLQHKFCNQFNNFSVDREIGKTLRKIDGSVIKSHTRHHCENGCTYIWKTRLNFH